jgi:broad specificity phosphatase PhoE
MIRHGFSTANATHRFAGHSDFPLSDIGHKQAELAAEYLFANEKIDKIYASDLARAYQTAVPTAEKFGLPVIPERRLREIYAGRWEGMLFDDIFNVYHEDFFVWRNDFARARCTEGESVTELYSRVVSAVIDLAAKNDGKCILLASHATPLRAVECFAAGKSADYMGQFNFPTNASIQYYTYENGHLVADKLNVVDHLDGLLTALPKGV